MSDVYVPEKRRCVSCGHTGTDEDSHPTMAYCSYCGESCPEPEEDLCPNCGTPNCMCLACPECEGYYALDDGSYVFDDGCPVAETCDDCDCNAHGMCDPVDETSGDQGASE